MGSLSSCIQKIEDVWFCELDSRPLKNIVSVVYIDRYVYALHNNGNIYTTNHIGGRCHQVNTDMKDASVRALLAFGLITRVEAKKHGERKAIRDKVRDIVHEATRDAKYLKEIGIELTKQQLTRIKNLRKRVKADDIPFWLGEKAKAEVMEKLSIAK